MTLQSGKFKNGNVVKEKQNYQVKSEIHRTLLKWVWNVLGKWMKLKMFNQSWSWKVMGETFPSYTGDEQGLKKFFKL